MQVPSLGISDPLGISQHDGFQRECIQRPQLQNSFHSFFSEKIQGGLLIYSRWTLLLTHVHSFKKPLSFHGLYPVVTLTSYIDVTVIY